MKPGDSPIFPPFMANLRKMRWCSSGMGSTSFSDKPMLFLTWCERSWFAFAQNFKHFSGIWPVEGTDCQEKHESLGFWGTYLYFGAKVCFYCVWFVIGFLIVINRVCPWWGWLFTFFTDRGGHNRPVERKEFQDVVDDLQFGISRCPMLRRLRVGECSCQWKLGKHRGKLANKRWGTDPKASHTRSQQFSCLALSSLSRPRGFGRHQTVVMRQKSRCRSVPWWEVYGWSGNAEMNDNDIHIYHMRIYSYYLMIFDLNLNTCTYRFF